MSVDTNKNEEKKPKRTRLIKQRVAHVIFGLDLIDQCIAMTETGVVDIKELNRKLKRARKEVGKI